MTSRDHARRLLLVLLANERHHAPARELDDAAVEAEGPRAVAESGAGRDALAEVRDAEDEWRMWAPPSAAWGATRTS
jgi:hypothetical protein